MIQAALIPGELDAAYAAVLPAGHWAVCLNVEPIRCHRVTQLTLTAAEARQVTTAWPRLKPIAEGLGDVIVAVPRTMINYALFVSMDPRTAPTVLTPGLSSVGVAYVELGPYLPPGRYLVMVQSRTQPSGASRNEAVGVTIEASPIDSAAPASQR